MPYADFLRRYELQGSRVGVTVVHPGGVATAIAESAQIPASLSAEEVARQRAAMRKMLKLPPEVAGETIIQGVERRKARVLVGTDAKIIAMLVRVAPVSTWRLLERGLLR